MNEILHRLDQWVANDGNTPRYEKLFFASLSLVAVLIPFGGIVVSYSIALCVLLFTICAVNAKAKKVIHPTITSLLVSLYLIFVLSLVYTTNINDGTTELGKKFSLLLFPILFSVTISFTRINTEKILWAFVAGCALSGFSCLAISIVNFYNTHQPDYFFYNWFSRFIHPGYYSMYLDFAIAFLCWNRISKNEKVTIPSIVFYFLLLLFISLIILLSSKAGIITLFVLLLIFFSSILFNNLRIGRVTKLVLSLSLLTLTFLFLFFSFSSQRFKSLNQLFQNENIDKTTTESTEVRELIWMSSIKLIKENWLFGVGIGDVSDELNKRYEELGMTGALEKSLNAHNQFLQMWIGTGIIGLLILSLVTLLMLFRSVLRKDILLALFLLLIIFNFMVESMLQTAAGVVFFAFFNSLLVLNPIKTISHERD